MTKTNAEYLRKHKRKNRLLALGTLGGVCEWCEEDDIRVLEIDHVNDDGHKEKVPRDATYYKKVAADETGRYQLLCSNCNTLKKWKTNRK